MYSWDAKHSGRSDDELSKKLEIYCVDEIHLASNKRDCLVIVDDHKNGFLAFAFFASVHPLSVFFAVEHVMWYWHVLSSIHSLGTYSLMLVFIL